MILIEVFDHDVLSADDGLGQVSLPIKNIKAARMDSTECASGPRPPAHLHSGPKPSLLLWGEV